MSASSVAAGSARILRPISDILSDIGMKPYIGEAPQNAELSTQDVRATLCKVVTF
jgi:hypothetical protein